MKTASISIYYNKEFGYIIASDTMVKGLPIHTVVEPVITKDPKISKEILGEAIKEGLEKSLHAELVELSKIDEYKYWQVSKIKSFAAFSKKFRNIEITEQGNYYEIEEWKRDTDGSYAAPADDIQQIKVSTNADFAEVAKIVMNCLADSKDKQPVSSTFQTLENRTVTYKRPSDHFQDVGDGNTDAYQIYAYDENGNNYIAFLIDNGYLEYKKDAIKTRWEKIYGDLLEYKFKEVNDGMLKIRVRGKTKNRIIISNIYQEEDAMLEVLAEIDMSLPDEIQNTIKKEYEEVVSSIEIR